VHFGSFLKPQYLGTDQGSSLAELSRAAREAGFYAIAVENLNEDALRNLQCPLILHVKADFNARLYNHYILCLRVTPEGVRVFDPPSTIKTESVDSVLGRTDGIGLLISRSISLEQEIAHRKQWRIALFAIVSFLGCCYLARFTSRQKLSPHSPTPPARFRKSMRQAMFLTLASVSLGLTINSLNENGLLADRLINSAAIADVPAVVIDKSQLQSMLVSGNIVVLDARRGADFLAGHIPGAINIPANSDDGDRQRSLSAVPLDQPVVVYCQSQGCPYADLILAGLRSDGRKRLLLYRGGWLDWSAAQTVAASH